MGIIWTIIIGFFIGLVARFIKPGDDNMGIIMTSILGIGGAFVGSLLGRGLGIYGAEEPAGFIASTIGAILLLVIVGAMVGKRKTI